jgi:hypothetical protein
MHANIVLSQDLLDYSPLFVEIADAYFDQEMYSEASPLYELLGEDAAVSHYCCFLLHDILQPKSLKIVDKQFWHTVECSSLPPYAWQYARGSRPL